MDYLSVCTAGLTGGRIHIDAVPIGLSLVVSVPEDRGIVVTADRLCHYRGHLHHVDVDGVVDDIRWSPVVKGQPVSQSRSFGGKIRMLLTGFIECHSVEPVHHCLDVLLDDPLVSVLDVHLPRNLADSGGPGCSRSECGVIGLVVRRDCGAYSSRNLLVISHTLVSPQRYHPLAVEILSVRVVDACPGVCLGISRPAHPLISLGTVCGNCEEVTELASLDVLEQLVQKRSSLSVGGGGFVASCRNLRRREYESFDIPERERPGV